MKKILLLPLFCFVFNLGFTQEENSFSPEILLQGNIAFSYIEDFETPLAFGIGTEAKINNRFSLGGSLNYGGSDSYSRLIINPNLKFYPKEVFKGFFFSTGISYYQLRSKSEFKLLGYPFDKDRGGEANFFTLQAGIGVSTLVKNRWAVGVSLALAAPFDLDLEPPMIESNFTVGYAF